MMNVGQRVRSALSERGYTQRKLCSELEITENGFKHMVDNNTWKVDTLAKIATILGTPITYFISDDEVDFDFKSKPTLKEQEVTGLKELRMLFETQLQAKDRQIEKLLDLLGKLEGAISQTAFAEGDTRSVYILTVLREYINPMLGINLPVGKCVGIPLS